MFFSFKFFKSQETINCITYYQKSMKKLTFILLIAASISTTICCNKEINQTEQMSDALSVSSSITINPDTKFGVLPNNVQGDKKVTVANNLEVDYVRNSITVKDFTGKSPMQEKYNQHGFKIVLNLNWDHVQSINGTKTAVAFPTNMTDYKNKLQNVLNKYKPEIAVIENEPYNDLYYKGPINDYFNELSAAISVCKQKGIKVADGGLNPQMVSILVYQNYVNKGQQKQADDFGKRALTDANLNAAKGKGSKDINAKIDKTKSMINNYKKSDLDYVNLHWYEPIKTGIDQTISSPGVLKEIADYLRTATGKEVITNEFRETNEKTTLIKSMVNAFKSANFKYAIDFSGEGQSGAVSLTNGTTLKPNGKAYRDAIK